MYEIRRRVMVKARDTVEDLRASLRSLGSTTTLRSCQAFVVPGMLRKAHHRLQEERKQWRRDHPFVRMRLRQRAGILCTS